MRGATIALHFSFVFPQIIDKLVGMLDCYMGYVDDTPPLEQPQRFGNKAYRAWSDLVRDVSEMQLDGALLHL